jgi:dTDP-4-dehydrorhamnose reductase
VQLAPAGTTCLSVTRQQLDIADDCAVWETLEKEQPEIVFNGAAYNLVDKAEADGMDDALRINALGPARLAKACREMAFLWCTFPPITFSMGAKVRPIRKRMLPDR